MKEQSTEAASDKTTSTLFNLLSALLAFLMWGVWAYYVNNPNGVSIGVKSGLIQGTASALITLIMVRIVAHIHHALPQNRVLLFVPALLTVSITGSCIVVLHWLAHTPDIVGTVVPPLGVAFMFCVFTTYKLQSVNKEDCQCESNKTT